MRLIDDTDARGARSLLRTIVIWWKFSLLVIAELRTMRRADQLILPMGATVPLIRQR